MKRLLMILVVLVMVFGLMIVVPGVASAGPLQLCAGGVLGAGVSAEQPEAARTFGKNNNPTTLAGLGPYPIAPGLAGLCSANLGSAEEEPWGWQHYNPAKDCDPAHPFCPSSP